jgi:hypothetical protein
MQLQNLPPRNLTGLKYVRPGEKHRRQETWALHLPELYSLL